MQLIPLLLGGEAGAKSEPASQASNSKPSIGAADEHDLLQKCILRGTMLPGVHKLISVLSREFFYANKEELNATPQNMSFILEPFRRNSAALVAAAATHITQFHNEDTLILVLPVNRLNVPQDVFQQAIAAAAQPALRGNLVTFGMPIYETNAKYSLPKENNKGAMFVEEPSFQMRSNTLAPNQFLWNSNLFLFKAGTILQAMKVHCPEVLVATLNCLKHSELSEQNSSLIIDLNPSRFFSIPEFSINEVVIKKSRKTVVLPCDLEWLD